VLLTSSRLSSLLQEAKDHVLHTIIFPHFLLNTVVTFMDLENRQNHLTVDLQSRRSPVVDAAR
jgi:hypothetical protein